MSLVNQALVLIAAYVLEDKTWAGKQIFRQPVNPLSEILQGPETQRPFLAVYTESNRFDVEGRATNGQQSNVEFKIFVHIAPGVTVTTDPVTNAQEFTLTMDTSTVGMTLDFMGRMVDAAFHTPGTWFDVWNRFVISVERRETKYSLYETEDGIRVPTMEITYRLNAIPDPQHGSLITSMKGWSMLDSALRARGGEAVDVANLLKDLIEAGSDLPDYAKMQALFGLTSGGLAATGLATPVTGAVNDDGTTVVVTDIGLDTEVTVVAPVED